MSFRKRNVGISDGRRSHVPVHVASPTVKLSGVRPSAVDGRPVTSTGSPNFDNLFAGHGGMPLGTSTLIEESGATDYSGALLRFFAAEGLLQDHFVHVVGLPEQWARDLPGVVKEAKQKSQPVPREDRMKIAWRYERLGQHEEDSQIRERATSSIELSHAQDVSATKAFCHLFDLSKRLEHPVSAQLKFYFPDSNPSKNSFAGIISSLSSTLRSSGADKVHRVVVPSLMSPALYPPVSSLPEQVLTFQHSLRKLLAEFPKRLVIVQTLPLSLYPRTSGLTTWIELLVDAVYDFTPFPHSAGAEFQSSRDSSNKEEPPQGLLRVQKLPILHELGVGVPLADTDWTFTLSRRKFTIKPFNLPPIEGDTESQQHATDDATKSKKVDLEF